MSPDFFSYWCSDQVCDSSVNCNNVPNKLHIVLLVTKRLTEGNNHQVYRAVSALPIQGSPTQGNTSWFSSFLFLEKGERVNPDSNQKSKFSMRSFNLAIPRGKGVGGGGVIRTQIRPPCLISV